MGQDPAIVPRRRCAIRRSMVASKLDLPALFLPIKTLNGPQSLDDARSMLLKRRTCNALMGCGIGRSSENDTFYYRRSAAMLLERPSIALGSRFMEPRQFRALSAVSVGAATNEPRREGPRRETLAAPWAEKPLTLTRKAAKP